VEDVARFAAWLRAPAENVIVLADGGVRRPATVNRQHQARALPVQHVVALDQPDQAARPVRRP
jgi:hypothetical protein